MRFTALLTSVSAVALGASAAAIAPRQDANTTAAEFTAYSADCGGIGLSFPVSVDLAQAGQCNLMPLGNSYGSILLRDVRESNPTCTFVAFANADCTEGTGVELVSHICVDAPSEGRWRAYKVECAAA